MRQGGSIHHYSHLNVGISQVEIMAIDSIKSSFDGIQIVHRFHSPFSLNKPSLCGSTTMTFNQKIGLLWSTLALSLFSCTPSVSSPQVDPIQAPQAACPPSMNLIPSGTTKADPVDEGASWIPANQQIPVKAFCLQRNEVTMSDYQRCVTAGKCKALSSPEECVKNINFSSKIPVHCAYPLEATFYCRAHGWRLPWKHEWLRAIGYGSTPTYTSKVAQLWAIHWEHPYAQEMATKEICLGHPFKEGPCEVGSSKLDVNIFGINDMIGNADEWILADWPNYRISRLEKFPSLNWWITARPHATLQDPDDKLINTRGIFSFHVGGFRCAKDRSTL
jgi:formylglycine-generating enzyme required for sulfatase activity